MGHGMSQLPSPLIATCLTEKTPSQASYIARVASKYSPVLHMTGDATGAGRRPGVWVTNDIKQTMRRDMYNLLDTKRITFWNHFISGCGTMRSILASQLRNYKYEVKDARDIFGKARVLLTGKASGVNDDLAICIQMVAFWSQVHYQKPNAVMRVDPRGEDPWDKIYAECRKPE